MKNLKNKFILASAILALASCADNSYLGENEENPQGTYGAIQFGSTTPSLTRATDAEAAEELNYSFNVYGTKTISGASDPINVFAQNTYNATSNTPYWVWYGATTANTTTSNTKDWDYVGTNGSSYGTDGSKVQLTADQTIKYWDYSATQYDFVAYKAKELSNSTKAKVTNLTTTGFTVEGTAEQLGNLYIADKVSITNKNNSPSYPASGSTTTNKIGDIVKFEFRNAAAKVRIGFYETIPGYVVNNVKFYHTGITTPGTTATLDGNFIGDANNSGKYTVTFGSPSTFAKDNTTFFQDYHDFGSITYAATTEALGNGIGITSITPSWAGSTAAANYYSYMLPNPNPSDVNNMILHVDYDLYNSKTEETIHVYGAKAVVPAAYMSWKSNYAYTYLFKISDNTNGQTSTAVGTPVGLYPITFDAVTTTDMTGNQGTITTVSTPSITTYQSGSVSNSGITYANANGAIYITVYTESTSPLAILTDKIKLYSVATGTTEADLMLHTPTTGEVTGSAALSVLGSDEPVEGITFKANQTAKFTPDNPAANTVNTYAVQYLVSDAVAEAYTAAFVTANEDIPGNTYYEQSGTDPNFTYSITTDTKFDGNKTYYTHTPASPAVYQYKVIVVSPNPPTNP